MSTTGPIPPPIAGISVRVSTRRRWSPGAPFGKHRCSPLPTSRRHSLPVTERSLPPPPDPPAPVLPPPTAHRRSRSLPPIARPGSTPPAPPTASSPPTGRRGRRNNAVRDAPAGNRMKRFVGSAPCWAAVLRLPSPPARSPPAAKTHQTIIEKQIPMWYASNDKDRQKSGQIQRKDHIEQSSFMDSGRSIKDALRRHRRRGARLLLNILGTIHHLP